MGGAVKNKASHLFLKRCFFAHSFPLSSSRSFEDESIDAAGDFKQDDDEAGDGKTPLGPKDAAARDQGGRAALGVANRRGQTPLIIGAESGQVHGPTPNRTKQNSIQTQR